MVERWKQVSSARNEGWRNAFNSARWKNICQALHKLEVPAYLKNMIKSYLANRLLVYNTEDGSKEYQVTGGVP